MRRPLGSLILLLIGLSGTGPAEAQVGADTAASVRWVRFAVERWDAAAAERQRAYARGLRRDTASAVSAGVVLRRLPDPGRLLRALALAQRDAAPDPAAVAGASAAVLDALFPTAGAEARLAAELVHLGRTADDPAVARGRERADRWVARTDGVGLRWDGVVPEGEGRWRPAPGTVPAGAAAPLYPLYVLDRPDRFRPPAPPAFGSPAFEAALDDVRRATRERTAEQAEAARRWANRNAFLEWNGIAADLLARQNVPDPDAAETLALLNVALFDGFVACWEAKYHYWLVRPTQVDPSIPLPDAVALPNFPAYPAGHGCTAGSAEVILAGALPEEAEAVRELAAEMAESRLWAGVHYRFDNEAGVDLGRAVAHYVLEHAGRLDAPED